jgi:hypothetical protein
MNRKQITHGLVAAAILGAASPVFAQGTAATGSVNATTNSTATLPSAKPRCVNAPINNVPKDCAPDVSAGAAVSGTAASGAIGTGTTPGALPGTGSADILKQNTDANASVGIGTSTSPTKPATSARPATPTTK